MNELQTTWGWLVALYLFLGGIGAGAAITAHLIALVAGERRAKTVAFGAWVGAFALGIGSLVLLADVGKPFRALVLFRSFVNPDSWMMRGAWLLFATMLLDGLSALLWTERTMGWLKKIWSGFFTHRRVWRSVLAVPAVLLNLGVAAYTGVLLSVLQFIPLWHTWWLPALFTASALDTGIGAICAFATYREKGANVLHKVLEGCVVAIILIEGAILAVFMRTMLAGTPDAVRSISLWLDGSLAVAFWLGVVSLGLAVPLVVAFAQLVGFKSQALRWARPIPFIGVACCLAGGWMLRFIVLSAGQRASLASPYFLQAIDGLRYWVR